MASKTPVDEELYEVGRRVGVRPRRVNIAWATGLGFLDLDLSCRFKERDCRVEWLTDGARLLWVIHREVSIAFAAGHPDRVLIRAEKPLGIRGGVPIFTTGDNRWSPESWLVDPENLESLERLNLGAADSLLVAASETSLTVEPKGIANDWARFGVFVEFALRLPSVAPTPPVVSSNYPPELRSLVPLLEDWAVSDDQERSERIEHASTRDLKAMVEAVLPRILEVNQYLDTVDRSDVKASEAASLFDALAQAALEGDLELNTRSKAKPGPV